MSTEMSVMKIGVALNAVRKIIAKHCRMNRIEGDTPDESANSAMLLISETEEIQTNTEKEFVLHSAASDNMMGNKSIVHNVMKIRPRNIILGNGAVRGAFESAELTVLSNGRVIKFSNVLFVEGLKVNLESVT